MLGSINIKINDPKKKKFEFVLTFGKEDHIFKTSTEQELEEWISIFKKAIALAHPLVLNVTTVRPKRNRESKLIDANELISRQRLSSGRSVQYPSLDSPVE